MKSRTSIPYVANFFLSFTSDSDVDHLLVFCLLEAEQVAYLVSRSRASPMQFVIYLGSPESEKMRCTRRRLLMLGAEMTSK